MICEFLVSERHYHYIHIFFKKVVFIYFHRRYFVIAELYHL